MRFRLEMGWISIIIFVSLRPKRLRLCALSEREVKTTSLPDRFLDNLMCCSNSIATNIKENISLSRSLLLNVNAPLQLTVQGSGSGYLKFSLVSCSTWLRWWVRLRSGSWSWESDCTRRCAPPPDTTCTSAWSYRSPNPHPPCPRGDTWKIKLHLNSIRTILLLLTKTVLIRDLGRS